ncbi:MAG: XTP/dITP diphosphatase [Candidatus Thorarchaeota archaeon]|nr:MAG: XTP/dITP diphosphatase [Candidatus Thorarchaeota archaeon]
MSRDKLVLVTQNKHKLAELRPLFEKFDVSFETTSVEKFEIRADDVEAVAHEAAITAYDALKRPVVLDDTGLFVDALNGFPGTYSAYVLKAIGNAGILRLMNNINERAAKFVTAVGYADGDAIQTFVGVMSGNIARTPAGEEGFGYDPIFVPQGETRTYAQLSLSEKVNISHRTKAFRRFLDWYTKSL